MSKIDTLPPLEAGVLTALRAIDNQVARELQRTPADLTKHGVQKWEPFQKRIESISSFIIECLGERRIELDGILVLAQALTKTLSLLIDDLGEKGLGKVRTGYCVGALENIIAHAERTMRSMKGDGGRFN